MQIIDNFFKNPHDVRRLAISLKDDYFDCEVYSWPGRRVEVPDPLKSQYASRIREAVGDDKLSLVNCYFQWVDHSYVGGSTHFDPYVYTCITYLNENPLSNSGTEVYDSIFSYKKSENVPDRLDEFQYVKCGFYKSQRNNLQKIGFNRKLKKSNSYFKDPCVVANKFNRSVIFESPRLHRAQNFFGNSIKDSRFTIIAFMTYPGKDPIRISKSDSRVR
tara:strand:+ start:364 stop:1017 length:654 start_codon:yes stop_codon:yes gene_type:complete